MFEWILKLICSEERIRSIFSWLDTNWGIQLETKAQTQERLQEEARLEHKRLQEEARLKHERIQKEIRLEHERLQEEARLEQLEKERQQEELENPQEALANVEKSKKLIKDLVLKNHTREDHKSEMDRFDKMTKEEQLDEFNKTIAAIKFLLKNPEEKIIRQQKLEEINKKMEQWQTEKNIPQAISNNQNNSKEVDISKLLDLKHIQKESSKFEKIDASLPRATATGQAYKFKKTLKEGEGQKDKHEKIWYGKKSSAGEVAKAIGMMILFNGAAKYRFVKNGISVGNNDVKNVFSQEIKGQSLAQYCANLDLEYKRLVVRKWLYSNKDIKSQYTHVVNFFYDSEKMLPLVITRALSNSRLVDNDTYSSIRDLCIEYLLLPSNIEAVIKTNNLSACPHYRTNICSDICNEHYLVGAYDRAYCLTETQNKEYLRASFYNYITRNWDAHDNNLMITEDKSQIIPFDFDVVYNLHADKTLITIKKIKKYLEPDKFKEYIQEFIVDLEIKKDQYHSAMETLYQILKIKGRPYDKTEIETNLQTLKILAGIPLEQKKETWVEHSTSQNQSSDKQIK